MTHLTDPTYAALLRAVLHDPEDDAPRLILADWLQENGHGAEGDALRRAVLRPRTATFFLADLFPKWDFPRLPPEAGLADAVRARWRVKYRRGYAFSVSLPTSTFVRHAAGLFAAHPITEVGLWGQEPSRRIHRDTARPRWVWDHYFVTDPEDYPSQSHHDIHGGDDVPTFLWRYLGGRIGGRDYYRSFPSKAAAVAALSNACVRWGRDLVGLPPLEVARVPR